MALARCDGWRWSLNSIGLSSFGSRILGLPKEKKPKRLEWQQRMMRSTPGMRSEGVATRDMLSGAGKVRGDGREDTLDSSWLLSPSSCYFCLIGLKYVIRLDRIDGRCFMSC
mmetsp:Transcript_6269/g.12593  ORF Transcript_6269/g.12593 Transcript_6269/m.12593 type:complete len:112 (+) Transcript_6269:485-820(+)